MYNEDWLQEAFTVSALVITGQEVRSQWPLLCPTLPLCLPLSHKRVQSSVTSYVEIEGKKHQLQHACLFAPIIKLGQFTLKSFASSCIVTTLLNVFEVSVVG